MVIPYCLLSHVSFWAKNTLYSHMFYVNLNKSVAEGYSTPSVYEYIMEMG